MYLCGIPFNTVTLAALIVVLGMIVDNSIVVIDGYLDYLGRGYSRWYAAVESAREFFPSLLLATVCICMIFYPLLFTLSGMFRDFLNFFPWTVTINLMVSLLLAVLVIPFLEVLIIPVVQPRPEGKVSLTDRVQNLYRMLRADDRVKSVTSFVGCSSPRFQMSYAPQIAGKNFAQFIVNTVSIEATEEILDEYADRWADRFPEAYVKFKQLDYQNVPSLEFRFYGDDLDSLHVAAERLMDRMRAVDGLQWIHSDYEEPRAIAEVTLDPVTAAQLGVTRTMTAANLALAAGDVAVGAVWEGDYKVSVVLKNEDCDGERSLSDVADTYVSSLVPGVSAPPLRQIASVEPRWSESKIVHRNGMRCITVSADLQRGVNAMWKTAEIRSVIDNELRLPQGGATKVGGAREFNEENLPPIICGLAISLVIMAAMSLCLFGAMVGLWIAGFTIGLISVLGFITLLGMIVRNVILMYQHAEGKRKTCHWSARLAAYDAGKRRMVPIFLTTATTAVGVVPMMFGGSSFWAPVGVTIFAGGIGSLILVVTILPVLYSKIYK